MILIPGQIVKLKKPIKTWSFSKSLGKFKNGIASALRAFLPEVHANAGDILEVMKSNKNGTVEVAVVGTLKYGFDDAIGTIRIENLEESTKEEYYAKNK